MIMTGHPLERDYTRAAHAGEAMRTLMLVDLRDVSPCEVAYVKAALRELAFVLKTDCIRGRIRHRGLRGNAMQLVEAIEGVVGDGHG